MIFYGHNGLTGATGQPEEWSTTFKIASAFINTKISFNFRKTVDFYFFIRIVAGFYPFNRIRLFINVVSIKS